MIQQYSLVSFVFSPLFFFIFNTFLFQFRMKCLTHLCNVLLITLFYYNSSECPKLRVCKSSKGKKTPLKRKIFQFFVFLPWNLLRGKPPLSFYMFKYFGKYRRLFWSNILNKLIHLYIYKCINKKEHRYRFQTNKTEYHIFHSMSYICN